MTFKFENVITADPEPFNQGMLAAVRSAAQAAQQIQATFASSTAGITDAFTRMKAVIVGVGSAIAASAFVGSIARAIDLQAELGRLSQKVGITVEGLSGLRFAAQNSDLSMEQLTTGLKKLSTLMFNAAAGSEAARQIFKGLNVEFESSPGKLKPTDEVLLAIADRFSKMEDGATKAALAVKLFGKQGLELIPFLNQGKAGIAQLTAELERLGGVMTGEMAEQAELFNRNLRALEASSNALKVSIANRMLPGLTDITAAMREAVKEGGMLLGAWVALGGAASIALGEARKLAGLADTDAEKLTSVQKKIAALQSQLTLKSATDTAKLAWQRQLNALLAEEVVLANKIADTAAPARVSKPPKITPDVTDFANEKPPRAIAEKNPMAEWEGRLKAQRDAYDQMKLDQGSFEQYTVAMERDYWQKILTEEASGAEQQTAVSNKLYDAKRKISTAEFEGVIADLKAQMQAAETNAQERINLAGRIYTLEVERHKAGSKEAIAALAEVQKEYDRWAKQQKELLDLQATAERDYQLGRVELERQSLDTMEALGQINAKQKIARLKDLAEIDYAANLKLLEDKKALIDPWLDPIEFQKATTKILEIKQKHVLEMGKLDSQMALEAKRSFDQWVDPALNAFGRAVNGVISATQRMSDIVRGALLGMVQEYAQAGLKIVADWINTQAMRLLASTQYGAMLEAEDAAQGAAMAAAAAVSAAARISTSAAEAGAAGVASAAAIPIIGWELAPAAGAMDYAAAMAFAAGVFAAEGGFNIPAGMNPLTQLHAEEMVLPKDIANPLRDSLAGGGGAVGGDTHFHVHAVDAKGVEQLLRNNAAGLNRVLREQARNFAHVRK